MIAALWKQVREEHLREVGTLVMIQTHNTTNGRQTHSPTQTKTLRVYIYDIEREVCVTCFSTRFNSAPSDLGRHYCDQIFCGPTQSRKEVKNRMQR